MIELEKYEDVMDIIKERKNTIIDLTKMNYADYSKVIVHIKNMNYLVKKVTRSKFVFLYE